MTMIYMDMVPTGGMPQMLLEYILKKKKALRLIINNQNKILEEKEITIRFATSYDLKFYIENYEKFI